MGTVAPINAAPNFGVAFQRAKMGVVLLSKPRLGLRFPMSVGCPHTNNDRGFGVPTLD